MKLSEKVIDKKFSTKNFGFDAREVDLFLDELNVEIAKLENTIESLNGEIMLLKNEKASLNSKVTTLQIELNKEKASSFAPQTSSQGSSNMELVSRVSNIESKIEQILNLLNNKS